MGKAMQITESSVFSGVCLYVCIYIYRSNALRRLASIELPEPIRMRKAFTTMKRMENPLQQHRGPYYIRVLAREELKQNSTTSSSSSSCWPGKKKAHVGRMVTGCRQQKRKSVGAEERRVDTAASRRFIAPVDRRDN